MTVSTEQPWVSNEPSQVPHDDTTKENAGMSEAQPMLSGDQAEQERKRQKDANNPICKLFSRVNMCTIFRWIAAIIVLGVSANQVATGTISKTKPPASLIVAVSSVQVAMFWYPVARPRSPSQATPSRWYIAVMAASATFWAGALACGVVMILVTKEHASEIIPNKISHSCGKFGPSTCAAKTDARQEFEMSCFCTGAIGLAILCCVAQFFHLWRIWATSFVKENMSDAYEQIGLPRSALSKAVSSVFQRITGINHTSPTTAI